MQILRASDYKRMPWKNGGGETTEIMVSPPGASLDDFDWRVSMATVASDGPFSRFPGIDRTLSILEGAGMTLVIDGTDTVTLDATSAPHAFPADAATTATLVSGAIRDLNVMSRRGRISHEVVRHQGPVTLHPAGSVRLLLAMETLTVTTAGSRTVLGPLDCVVLAATEELGLNVDGSVYVMTFAFIA